MALESPPVIPAVVLTFLFYRITSFQRPIIPLFRYSIAPISVTWPSLGLTSGLNVISMVMTNAVM